MGKAESRIGTFEGRLASIGDFLKQLYIAGGIPLVLIGIGAANTFIPYADAPRWVVSVVLIFVGALSWGASTYVTLLRWKTKAQIVAEQDALVLKTVCDIARSSDSEVAGNKMKVLRQALEGMGLRSLFVGDESDSGSASKTDSLEERS